MPEYTIDVYAVATLAVTAPTEAAARKLLETHGQEMEVSGGPIALDNDFPDEQGVTLSGISHRKVMLFVDGKARPNDGAIEELEYDPEPEYCRNDECDNLTGHSDGWDGLCGDCADRAEGE